jgi:propionyl-CoA synthetase
MPGNYAEEYQRSLCDRETFWAEAARSVDWFTAPSQVLDSTRRPFYRWFPDGVTNSCHNALDRHVEAGRGADPALIYESPVTDTVQVLTFETLRDEASRFAGALRGLGVEHGDRVLIYMPMIPEAVVAMLACARLGAIHSVVFGGFAAKELATRIDDAKPKLVLSASCGIEVDRVIPYKPLLDGAIDLAKAKPQHCVVLQREQQRAELTAGRDLDWEEVRAAGTPVACTAVSSTDPLYILYTSGTTGVPKGVVRDNGGHLVALNWSMRHVYGMQPGEVFWAASDIGWVVGHSYIVYAPLFCGCASILFEGKPVGTPDAGVYWRTIERHGVSALFTAPTAIRAIKREDPQGEFVKKSDLSRFRTLFLAGERADPDTIEWAEGILGVPVIDHWWQTETGWPVAANCMGLEPLPVKRGSPTKPVPGYAIRIVDAVGKNVSTGTSGNIVIDLPLPPGCLPTLWNNDAGFVRSYLEQFPGSYVTGDAGHLDEDGYLYVMGRTDDIINIAGHRLSTGAMEEVLAGHPDVAECAVIGIADPLKGQVPVGFAVLKAGVGRDPAEVERELVQRVRAEIGPVAAFKQARVVARLPKTRSGKILRGTMRKMADGEAFSVPATIDDPVILDEIQAVIDKL